MKIPIAPIVLGNGGNVDLLRLRVGNAEMREKGEELLEGEDCEERGRVQVLLHHLLGDPRLTEVGRLAGEIQNLVVEALRDGAILFPPR